MVYHGRNPPPALACHRCRAPRCARLRRRPEPTDQSRNENRGNTYQLTANHTRCRRASSSGGREMTQRHSCPSTNGPQQPTNLQPELRGNLNPSSNTAGGRPVPLSRGPTHHQAIPAPHRVWRMAASAPPTAQSESIAAGAANSVFSASCRPPKTRARHTHAMLTINILKEHWPATCCSGRPAPRRSAS